MAPTLSTINQFPVVALPAGVGSEGLGPSPSVRQPHFQLLIRRRERIDGSGWFAHLSESTDDESALVERAETKGEQMWQF